MGGVLFWNINKKHVVDDIVKLCDEYEVDILILSECTIATATLLAALNGGSLKGYSYISDPSPSPKFHWYTRLPHSRLGRLLDDGGLSMMSVKLLTGKEVIIGAVHLVSKLNATDYEQLHIAGITAEAVRSIEDKHENWCTVLIGDFNMNPFDPGMASVTGFNAVMDRAIAERVSVKYNKEHYSIFYNPMWGHFGHTLPGTLGTHYFARKLIRYYWNMYDQVLIRPSLLNHVADNDVSIINRFDGKVVAASGKNWKCKSDHLPVFVDIR